MSSFEDPYTELVATRAGPNADPRATQIFSSLIRHLHHFAREVQLTNEEWLFACEALIGAERNEMILISDVLGVEALLDSMTSERFHAALTKVSGGSETTSTGGVEAATMSAILRNEPIIGAEVHIWHDGSKGLYDSQLFVPEHPEKHPYFNWRGIFTTDEEGRYSCIALKPTPYPIPYDNAAGAILKAMDNSPMRPAHIHFLIKAEGYRPLVTQVYDADCKYIDKDSVFGVKDSLTVKFTESSDKKRADTELEYDIVLAEDIE